MVDERDVVAELFGRRHVVGGEDDGGTLLLKVEDFVLEEVGVDWVETAEGFVQNQEGGFMQDGGDELYLLLHTFRR